MSETSGTRRKVYLLTVFVLCGLMSCRLSSIFRSASQEKAFREQYVGKQFYTGIVLRPYDYGNAYLVDLTGLLFETAYQTARAALTVPLGTPITITGIDRQHVVAQVQRYGRPFYILVRTKSGTLSEVAEELTLVLAETSPLQSVRSTMRPFIARQKVARGMSRKEVYMSWGRPDKVNSSPGASGFLEEWIYFDRQMHLFLKDGFVTNWQRF